MTTPTKVLDLRGLSATERDGLVTHEVAKLSGWRAEVEQKLDHRIIAFEYARCIALLRAHGWEVLT